MKIRGIFSILAMIVCIILFVSCSNVRNKYEDGEYYGEGQGHHSIIKVKVNVAKNKISDIKILEEEEIPGLKEIVYEKLPKKMKNKNTWEVDVVSGATLTSDGLIDAVEDALKNAVISQ